MDDVECLGNETDLVDCPFDGWSEHDCDRWTGAGVFCEDSKYTMNAFNAIASDF